MKLTRILQSKKSHALSLVFILFTLASLISSCQKDSVAPTTATAQPSLSINNAAMTQSLSAAVYTTSKPISYTGKNNITISGLSITAGSAPAITLKNCINVHITASRFINATGVNGVGVWLYNCTNVTIDYCYFNNVSSGIFASQSTGVYVANNQMKNMQGPMPRGQFVQFSGCYGPGNKIMSNRFENIMGSSNPEDAINIYQSKGTASDPITISGNWIRGGGPSSTGGGINLGDGGGSYQTADNNILVNPGQYGIAISAGTVMSILSNRIYGAKASFTNVGTFAWNQYSSTSGCSIITVSGNQINFTAAGGYQNPSWDGGNCGQISGWSNNTWGATNITAAILPATIITMQ